MDAPSKLSKSTAVRTDDAKRSDFSKPQPTMSGSTGRRTAFDDGDIPTPKRKNSLLINERPRAQTPEILISPPPNENEDDGGDGARTTRVIYSPSRPPVMRKPRASTDSISSTGSGSGSSRAHPPASVGFSPSKIEMALPSATPMPPRRTRTDDDLERRRNAAGFEGAGAGDLFGGGGAALQEGKSKKKKVEWKEVEETGTGSRLAVREAESGTGGNRRRSYSVGSHAPELEGRLEKAGQTPFKAAGTWNYPRDKDEEEEEYERSVEYEMKAATGSGTGGKKRRTFGFDEGRDGEGQEQEDDMAILKAALGDVLAG